MPAADTASRARGNLGPPYTKGVVISPNDSADLDFISCAIIVAVAGNVKVTWMSGDTSVVPVGIAGAFYPMRVKRIWNTDTTATGIQVVE